MILAYPINSKKKPIGPEKKFTDKQWADLQKLPNLRWVRLPDVVNECPSMFPSEYSNLNRMTKKEMVEFYGLNTEDMKLSKKEIINKITNE